MSKTYINAYSSVSCLGNSAGEMFFNALKPDIDFLTPDEQLLKGKSFPFGKIMTKLPEIKSEKYNLRCNALLLHCLAQINGEIKNAIKKYGKNRVGIVIGTTNSGIDEYERSKDIDHSQIGNPSGFLHKHLGLNGYYSSVSTACTSGIKAFSTAKKLLENGICDAVIAGGTDALCKMPVYGFHSLEVLSEKHSIPFSKNRNGINIGEGAALFLLEKEPGENSTELAGIGETSDAYHCATPDPEGIQASNAIKAALNQANIKPEEIDYINLHATGTQTNDLMEANAVFRIFGGKIPASGTKPLTGHCLGASAAVETALCCAMLDKTINKANNLLPHRFDGIYDDALPEIDLVKYGQKAQNLRNILCNAFGFGGSNAVLVLRKGK